MSSLASELVEHLPGESREEWMIRARAGFADLFRDRPCVCRDDVPVGCAPCLAREIDAEAR